MTKEEAIERLEMLHLAYEAGDRKFGFSDADGEALDIAIDLLRVSIDLAAWHDRQESLETDAVYQADSEEMSQEHSVKAGVHRACAKAIRSDLEDLL